jgi:hypothetical protein
MLIQERERAMTEYLDRYQVEKDSRDHRGLTLTSQVSLLAFTKD